MIPSRLNALYKLRSAVTRHRAISDTTRELEQSSDRTLADMGLARGDIASVADGSYSNGRTSVRPLRR